MPTPFTHLAVAERLLADPQLSDPIRALLQAERSAFLLGSVAADARVNSGGSRVDTHFYSYDQPIAEHPWRLMLAQHPRLRAAASPAQRAFLAGYVAHLAVDEYWSMEMLRPHFVERQWGTRDLRFFMLHIILIHMDERDYAGLAGWQQRTLAAAEPDNWLPFMDDGTLCGWRDLIARQLGGESETLEIFGGRIHKTPAEFRAVLDSAEAMQINLWEHIPQAELARVEGLMYEFAREQMAAYCREFARSE